MTALTALQYDSTASDLSFTVRRCVCMPHTRHYDRREPKDTLCLVTPCRSCSARRRARHRSCTNTLLFQWSDTLTRLFQAAAVGTVSVRSLVEPLRKIAARLRGHLINARAVDLVMSERLLEVETISPNGIEKQRMYIPYVPDAECWLRARTKLDIFSYDKIIIAVGSTSSTHGVPGLEHCFQLKTVGDAQAIRKRIIGT